MKRLIVLAVAALALSSCVDRGECLQSEDERYDYVTYIQIGSVMYPQYQTGTRTVCVLWEYPEGRPE